MSTVDISIFSKPYSVSCDDGQEKHLKELAVYLDRKVRSIATMLNQASSPGEMHLMVVTALTIADELNDITLEIADLKNEIDSLRSMLANKEKADSSGTLVAYQKTIETVAEKIETMAEELEKA